MTNTIDRFVFFFLHLIESLTSFRLPEKTSLIIAPLLPFSAIIIGLYFTYNSTLLFVLVIPLILTFILSVGSYDFFKGRNIFIISKSLRILRLSIKDYNPNIDVLQVVLERKCLEIKLIKEETIDIQLETISFSEVHTKMISDVFNVLSNEIISDDTVLEDFNNIIKQVSSKNINYKHSIVKLELPSNECSVFLDSIFIPLVKKVTGRDETLVSVYSFFYFLKSESYRPVNYGSITKKPRKRCKSSCEKIYNEALQIINKVG